jgi:hypothetical protein
MNTSFDAFRIVNSYGAFGSISKERFEVIVQGTDERVVTPATRWRDYEFRCKAWGLEQVCFSFSNADYITAAS